MSWLLITRIARPILKYKLFRQTKYFQEKSVSPVRGNISEYPLSLQQRDTNWNKKTNLIVCYKIKIFVAYTKKLWFKVAFFFTD